MKNILHKISKIISTIVFWILIVIIVILLGYVVSIKYLTSQNRLDEVKINFYTILTQSMYPTIKAGDIVLDYKNDNDVYKVGDIITFVSERSGGQITITHRVKNITIEEGKYYYETKGDGNSTADNNLVPSNNVIGKVIFTFPKIGFVQQFILSKFGWLVVIVIPCVGIIIYDLLKIFKIAYNKKKKKHISKDETEAKQQLAETITTDNVNNSKINNIISNISNETNSEIENIAPIINEQEKKESDEEIEVLNNIDKEDDQDDKTEVL